MVNEAKKLVLANLTAQGSIDVSIPRAHHRFVLGKGGDVLKKIQVRLLDFVVYFHSSIDC